ncbi:MAG TPA: flavodoxin-dependent (E)-4-hydroxy-3-methylbut-2-enyl-diphosphate synthase [Clostridiaceae bacterium]|nr:flavodoxin-dependent (E)-4-hydroxy-3-methylbut-2-enyl-diphosphate synthase [Clostridiaceae bacterium]
MRKRTRQVQVGGVRIGGDAPIAVQSMNTTDTSDVTATLAQITELAEVGCEITRLAIPDAKAANALVAICPRSVLPIVADIHYDYRLALTALKNGVNGLRINPGNLRDEEGLTMISEAARIRRVPIRVGVNAGSLDRRLINHYGGINEQAMAHSALAAAKQLEETGFEDICLSVKASDPMLTIRSYRLLSELADYPLHVGVTEAGTLWEGTVRSAVGIGTLLAEGIGDTIRVSLTANPSEEVKVAYAILRALGLRRKGAELISCPTCGRTQVDIMRLAKEVETRLIKVKAPLTVAVMGCSVNGPGEAREADIGLAGGQGEFVLFKKGQVIGKVTEAEVVESLFREIEKMEREGEEQLR